MKIIAFGASYSKQSINKKFAEYTATRFENATVELLDLSNYNLPIYTIDLEKEKGIPESVKVFLAKIKETDLLIISLSEHNGSYSAGFKNLFDWLSRLELNLFANKKMLLLSTAPGARGGQSVMETALARFPRHGAEIIGNFSLPKFQENFEEKRGIINEELSTKFEKLINDTKTKLNLIV